MAPSALVYDVVESIAARSFHEPTTLAAMCLVSHLWYSAAAKFLYDFASFSESQQRNALLFLRTVADRPELARMLTSLRILCGLPNQPSYATFVTALQHMSNLKFISCKSLDDVVRYDASVVDAIRRLSSLRGIRVEVTASTASNRVLGAISTISKLIINCTQGHFDHYGALERLDAIDKLLIRSTATLEEFSFYGYSWYDLESFMSDHPDVEWPYVANICCPSVIISPSTLRAFPNVRYFEAGRISTPLLSDKTLLPRLEQLSIITPGPSTRGYVTDQPRVLVHLAIDIQNADMFLPFLDVFYWPGLRTLHLKLVDAACAAELLRLSTFLEQAVDLRFLGVLTHLEPTAILMNLAEALHQVSSSQCLRRLQYVSVRSIGELALDARWAANDFKAMTDRIAPLFTSFPSMACIQLFSPRKIRDWRLPRSAPWAPGVPSFEDPVLPCDFQEIVRLVDHGAMPAVDAQGYPANATPTFSAGEPTSFSPLARPTGNAGASGRIARARIIF